MKRVMMEVLPTDWSPRKTSLYFARGASAPPPPFLGAEAVAGWAERDAAAVDDEDAPSLIILLWLGRTTSIDYSVDLDGMLSF
mmetsp:Transcript_28416/g.60554  ORF Transcript_28416/g.60554 Transcript_28416/m.60554 type:complete len:83 (-) Transcript_28416:69-317(-)